MPPTISARNLAAHSPRPPRPSRTKRKLLTVGALGLAGFVAGLLSGCAGNAAVAGSTTSLATGYAQLAGNWGFRTAQTSAAPGTQLTAFGGSLAVNGSAVTGTLHALTPGQCLSPGDAIPVFGTAGDAGQLTLSGRSAGGAAIIISGTIAADRRSLEDPTLSASGGPCATPHTPRVAGPRDNTGTTAQQFQPVSGTYTGDLVTAEGENFSLSTTVTQLDQPDASGTYHIQGTAAPSPGNTCLPASVTATASAVSGGTLSATFTDSTGATTITATGSASTDGQTLNLANWSLTSACGSDSGTGTLTRQ